MGKTTTRVTLLVVLGVVLAAVVAWWALQLRRPREYELQNGIITKLDVTARLVEVEFIHLRSGRTMTVTIGNVPEDCPIFIDGAPAKLSDLRPGDQVAGRGMVGADGTVRPQWVRATRATGDSGPATAPTAGS